MPCARNASRAPDAPPCAALPDRASADARWIDLSRDPGTGIETIRAHFKGHAYDPHLHASYLAGFTEQGVQCFHTRRSLQVSTPGKAFLLEPEEVHDGNAANEEGFTYAMLYLPRGWVAAALAGLSPGTSPGGELRFASTLTDDPRLIRTIADAFHALHVPEFRLARHAALDALLALLAGHVDSPPRAPGCPRRARAARDLLRDSPQEDIGLDDLARAAGTDRFSLTRLFKKHFGLPPHAYLVQLRLCAARELLGRGAAPADAAAEAGFADQSHLGRWFRRAYGMTPARYRARCTSVPDA